MSDLDETSDLSELDELSDSELIKESIDSKKTFSKKKNMKILNKLYSDADADTDDDDDDDDDDDANEPEKTGNEAVEDDDDNVDDADDAEDNDDDDDDDDDIDGVDVNPGTNKNKSIGIDVEYSKSNIFNSDEQISPINSDIESDEEDYLQKFNAQDRDVYINKYHPECITRNSIEIEYLTKITRDSNNNIIDNNHKTLPFLTKYEKTKILGQRTSQINMGAKPYITVPENIIDGSIISELELTAKKIPVIIRRPLPNNQSEYWKLQDLEQL